MRRGLAVLLCASLLACPQVTPAPLEPEPRITRFTSSASAVNEGESVTLTWDTADAAEVSLEEATLGALSTQASGSLEVMVPKRSLFVLTARNSRGATRRAVLTVGVGAAPGELQLLASPREIDVGEAVTLTWAASDASLTASPGGVIDVTGNSVVVSPTQSTTYTLTSGARTASTLVTVRPTVLTFTASTDAIDEDGAVTLSWTTANATRVRLLSTGRPTLVDSSDASTVRSGSFTDALSPDPGHIYRYELRVEGARGGAFIELPVRGMPVITSLEAPAYARIGQPVEVKWTTRDADSVSIFQGPVELHRTADVDAAASGRVTLVAPSSTLQLEAVARKAPAGETRRGLEVQVVGTPSVTLSATPSTMPRGTPYQLTWSGQSVRNLRLLGEDARVLLQLTDVTDTGTLPLTFIAGDVATFRLVVDNALGDVASSSLTVSPSDPFLFTASPAGAIPVGRRVTLSWTSGETLYGFPHDDVSVRSSSTGFDDISSTGTPVVFPGVTPDDEIGSIVTTFRAPFFGRLVGERISVSTNGYVTFGPANRNNYLDVALPTAKLEPLSIAPYWEDLILTNGGVHWQLKPSGGDEVLIIQWTNAATTTATGLTFQLKLFSTGRVDFEYLTMPATLGKSGLQGPRGDDGVPLGRPVAAALGATFFEPKQSPVSLVARSHEPTRAFLRSGNTWVPVQTRFDVVFPEALQLGEALLKPSPLVGAAGRWVEFFNARSTPISLDGWALELTDGGVAPLSGSVPAGGTRVFGTSVDRALNDDAGVDVALSTFIVDGARDSFTWALGSLSWNNPPTGIAQVTDYGPFRFEGDVAVTPSRAQQCFANARYGTQSPQQRGTPGTDVSCGFGYRWERARPGYFDISAHGRKLVDDVNVPGLQVDVDLASAPFTFFGTPRVSVRVSSDGYLTFDPTAPNSDFPSSEPSSSAPNSVIAIYADDLGGRFADSGIFVLRVPTNEDPFAAAPHWIFQWHRWAHLDGDDFNFQVKLFDDGSFEYHFAEMTSGTFTPYGTGVSANTWVENATGTQALVINASSLTPGISPHTAFRFSPR